MRIQRSTRYKSVETYMNLLLSVKLYLIMERAICPFRTFVWYLVNVRHYIIVLIVTPKSNTVSTFVAAEVCLSPSPVTRSIISQWSEMFSMRNPVWITAGWRRSAIFTLIILNRTLTTRMYVFSYNVLVLPWNRT